MKFHSSSCICLAPIIPFTFDAVNTRSLIRAFIANVVFDMWNNFLNIKKFSTSTQSVIRCSITINTFHDEITIVKSLVNEALVL